MGKKIILHLCADIGSDSLFYQKDPRYKVIKIGIDIGIENYHIPEGMKIHGIIANPPCTKFSRATGFDKVSDIDEGMILVNHCFRVIAFANAEWWVMENPARGRLKDIIGKPKATYQPWEFGSPWTKDTALWGNFNMPKPIYNKWEDVPKNNKLYIRGSRKKPGLVYFHKSAVDLIPEFQWARDKIKCDADIRSMCSQGFAKAFYELNP